VPNAEAKLAGSCLRHVSAALDRKSLAQVSAAGAQNGHIYNRRGIFKLATMLKTPDKHGSAFLKAAICWTLCYPSSLANNITTGPPGTDKPSGQTKEQALKSMASNIEERFRAGDLEGSANCYRLYLDELKKSGDRATLLEAKKHYAELLAQIAEAKEQKRLNSLLEKPREEIRMINGEGIEAYNRSDFSSAETLFIQGIHKYENRAGLDVNLASLWSNLATIYEARKEYQKAFFAYGKALDLKAKVLGLYNSSTEETRERYHRAEEKFDHQRFH